MHSAGWMHRSPSSKSRRRTTPAKRSADFKTLMKWGHRWCVRPRNSSVWNTAMNPYQFGGSVSSTAYAIASKLLGYLETADENGHIDYRLTGNKGSYSGDSTPNVIWYWRMRSPMHLRRSQCPRTRCSECRRCCTTSPRRWWGTEKRTTGAPRGRVMQCRERLEGHGWAVIALCEAERSGELSATAGLWNRRSHVQLGIWRLALRSARAQRHDSVGFRTYGETQLQTYCKQIAVAEPYLGEGGAELAALAHEAYERVNRGIVAYIRRVT